MDPTADELKELIDIPKVLDWVGLKDAEEDKARAQRSHDKELAHAAELSAQKVQVADLTGYTRAMNEVNRPRATFNTPSPITTDNGSLKYLMDNMPSQ